MMYQLLIVEDEKPLRKKLTENIDWEKHSYRVLEAVNGRQALSIIKTEDIDILVTDIKMPEMSGIELARKVREIKERIKVIIISGHAEFEYAQQSIRLGVDEYLLKPFRSRRLLEVVNKTREKLDRENRNRRELEKLRREIAEYLDHNQLRGTFNWLLDDDFFQKQSSIMDNSRLYQVLKTGSKEEILSELEVIFRELDNLQGRPQYLFIFLNNVILFTFRTLKELGYEFADLMRIVDLNYLQEIDSQDLADIKDWLVQFFLDVNTIISYHRGDQNEKLINEMKNYIKKNFSEGITLNQLAQKLNFSSGYLSRLFQEEVGKSFTDYLNMIRVNKAKELLKTTDLKVYQIADEVGFTDSYYFSSWFKKIVGVSPTTYRDNLDLLL